MTGRLVCHTLDEAVSGLCFLLGTSYRKGADSVIFVGGQSEKQIVALPSYGLSEVEVGKVLKASASVVGDRLIVDADEMRIAQVREVMENFRLRPSLVLELYVLDVAESQTDRVNAWLESFSLGAGYFARTFVPVGTAVEGLAALQTVKGPRYNVDIATALALQELGSGIKIEMREQVEVMSGSKVEFTSGEVVEDVTFVAQPNTEQLVSQITRRTVGLVLRLRATVAESSWHLALELEDGSLAGGTERNTKWTGERFVTPDSGFFLLGSFTRKTTTTNRQGVPLLRQAPWIGPIFGKSVTNLVNRQLMLLARPMSKAGARVGSSADDLRKVVAPASAPAAPADSTSKGRVYGPVPGPSSF